MTPAATIRAAAEAQLAAQPGNELGVASDARADPVLIGVATPRCSCVIAVPRAQYDGVALAALLQFPMMKQSAYEHAIQQKAA